MPLEHVRSLRISLTPHEVNRRQVIRIGLPFDVHDDVNRDLAFQEFVMKRRSSMMDWNDVNLTYNPHFFSSKDCSMFTSAQVCAEAFQRTTYLATYPCSGNTWTRSMFEHALLIYTGSVFCDATLKKMGFDGECMTDPRQVFMVKTHWPVLGAHKEGNGEKNLVIVRDPLHAALSYTVFQHGGSDHHTEIPEAELLEAFDKDAEKNLKQWAHMVKTMRNRKDVHIVRYEDIVANTSDLYLNDIFPYVGVNPNNPDVISRLRSAIEYTDNAYDSFHRHHSYVFEFTENHIKLAREIVGKDLAKQYGYDI